MSPGPDRGPGTRAEARTVHDAILLLGKDHATWGEYTLVETAGGYSSAALSVGNDPASPSMQSKGSRMYPNEDALLLVDAGDRVLMAVADAHRGHEASHALLEDLGGRFAAPPSSLGELSAGIAGMTLPDSNPDSGTTLLVAVHDRRVGEGFGVSFGDSSLVRVDSTGAVYLTLRRAQYLVPGPPIDPTDGLAFRFEAGPGALLLAFTDGVDECHYRSPATSIGARHIAAVFEGVGPHARRFTQGLAQLALAGVDGHPGGQDNIALVVSAAALEDR